MSLGGIFKKIVTWIQGHKVDTSDPTSAEYSPWNNSSTPGMKDPYSSSSGVYGIQETADSSQVAVNMIKEYGEYILAAGVVEWLIQLGFTGFQQKPSTVSFTNNKQADSVISSGLIIGALLGVWWLLKKIF